MNQIASSFKENIPQTIRLFLGKALLFFIIWKIIYSFVFFNTQVLDNFLTKHVGDASVYLLNTITPGENYTAITENAGSEHEGKILNNIVSLILHDNEEVLSIANICNGLELIVLYVGFIVCMPSSFIRKTKYILIGSVIIDAVNILRCVGLIYLFEYSELYFDFAHHYLFKIIVYSVTFILWIIFSRKININDKPV